MIGRIRRLAGLPAGGLNIARGARSPIQITLKRRPPANAPILAPRGPLPLRPPAPQPRGPGLAPFGEGQGNRIEAMPLTRRARPIREDVSQMAAATGAHFFHPDHSIARIANAFDVRFIEGHEKTGPTRARIEFRARAKQGQAAEAATVGAFLFIVEKDAAECRFSAMLQKDAPLVGVKTRCDAVTLDLGGRGQIKCRHTCLSNVRAPQIFGSSPAVSSLYPMPHMSARLVTL